MPRRRRVPLSRLWGLSLLAAGAALLGVTWIVLRDPGTSGQVRALEDARTLADQLEQEAVKLARRVATGEIQFGPDPIEIRFDAQGRLLDPSLLPAGRELQDRIVDPQQPRPTPAATWLREAEARAERQEWEPAWEAIQRGEQTMLAEEHATRARLMLLKATVFAGLARPREAARVLEALRTATEADHLLDGRPLRLLLGHRIAALWEDAGSPASAERALQSLLEEMLDGEVALPPARLGFEARMLLQSLNQPQWSNRLDARLAGSALAAELQPALLRTAASGIPLTGRVAFLDRASGRGVVVNDYLTVQLLRERITEALPPSGAFQVRAARDASSREVALRLVFPPGMPEDWWLILADAKAYSEPANRRRALLLTAMLTVVAALGVVGVWGARALRRRAELEQLRSDFIAGVSHELRTPAASLALLAGNLADGRVRDEKRLQQYFEAMQRDAVRLQRLVADVLDVTRLERGSFKVDPVPTDPAALVQPLAEDQRARLADAGLELRLVIEEGLPEVAIDPPATERAVANLIENARKYASEGGWVEVRVRRDGQELLIEVEDNGPGVPEAWRDRIFEAYERGAAEEGLAAGAGLGLALVKETMRAHGGRAELVPGQQGLTRGACFRLAFPIS